MASIFGVKIQILFESFSPLYLTKNTFLSNVISVQQTYKWTVIMSLCVKCLVFVVFFVCFSCVSLLYSHLTLGASISHY